MAGICHHSHLDSPGEGSRDALHGGQSLQPLNPGPPNFACFEAVTEMNICDKGERHRETWTLPSQLLVSRLAGFRGSGGCTGGCSCLGRGDKDQRVCPRGLCRAWVLTTASQALRPVTFRMSSGPGTSWHFSDLRDMEGCVGSQRSSYSQLCA